MSRTSSARSSAMFVGGRRRRQHAFERVAAWEAAVIEKTNMENFQKENAKMAANWRDTLKFIKSQRRELQANAGIMTEYERQTIGREIKRQQEAIWPAAVAGLLAEHRNSLQRYQNATAQVAKAKAAEVNRWRPDIFRAELDNASTLVRLAQEDRSPSFVPQRNVERLEGVYQDAKKSGDLYKQRAAFEVLQSLNVGSFASGDRVAVLSLKERAVRELTTLRETAEIVEASQERNAAVDDLYKCQQQMEEASQALGQGSLYHPFASGPLAREVRRVKVDQRTREVVILAEDDPEVTGVEQSISLADE